MSSSGNDQPINESSKRAVLEAKQEVDDAVRQYSQIIQLGSPDKTEAARARLHSSVITFFWRMRGHLIKSNCWVDMRGYEDWDGDIIWSGEHPMTGNHVEIAGLSDLEEWIDAEEVIEVPQEGPKNGATADAAQKVVTKRLPAEAALNAAKVLAQEFRAYGWDAKKQETPRDEPDMDDLAWLMWVRGQDEALERLPEDVRDKFETDFDNEDSDTSEVADE